MRWLVVECVIARRESYARCYWRAYVGAGDSVVAPILFDIAFCCCCRDMLTLKHTRWQPQRYLLYGWLVTAVRRHAIAVGIVTPMPIMPRVAFFDSAATS